jgi:hypothetical protein
MAGRSVLVEIVEARSAHAEALAPRIRPVELDEIAAAAGVTPLRALLDCLKHSDFARSALFDGEVACMWGVEHMRWSAVSGRVGAAWLLTSALVEKYPKTFWKHCREEVARIFRSYDLLVNAIDARHEQSLRWAKRLGFDLQEQQAYGVEGRPFVWFRAKKEECPWA